MRFGVTDGSTAGRSSDRQIFLCLRKLMQIFYAQTERTLPVSIKEKYWLFVGYLVSIPTICGDDTRPWALHSFCG